MPKKGIVKCRECDKEFDGVLPDNASVGYGYMSIFNEINKELAETLQHHHLDTATVKALHRNICGHKYFDVFLEDGSQGELEANSYCVIYKELGKER